jgi:hypothetical protein
MLNSFELTAVCLIDLLPQNVGQLIVATVVKSNTLDKLMKHEIHWEDYIKGRVFIEKLIV